MDKMEVAKTIKSQIRWNELFAIGAKNYVSLSSSNFGGLSFDASLFGKKKCKVAIELNGADLYNVCVFKGKMCEKLVGSAAGVFCEDLTDVVVSMVEGHFAS